MPHTSKIRVKYITVNLQLSWMHITGNSLQTMVTLTMHAKTRIVTNAKSNTRAPFKSQHTPFPRWMIHHSDLHLP